MYLYMNKFFRSQTAKITSSIVQRSQYDLERPLYSSMLRLGCALNCALSFPGKMDRFLDLSGWRRMVLCDVREYTVSSKIVIRVNPTTTTSDLSYLSQLKQRILPDVRKSATSK